MADNELNIILKLVDEATDKLKQAMDVSKKSAEDAGKAATNAGNKGKEAADKSSTSWLRLTLTIGGAIKAYRLLSTQIVDVIRVGRDMDGSFNKSWQSFDISILRIKQSIAENLIPYLKTALDFWTELINKQFSDNAAKQYNKELQEAQVNLKALTETRDRLQNDVKSKESSPFAWLFSKETIARRKEDIANLNIQIGRENEHIQTLNNLAAAHQKESESVAEKNIAYMQSKQLLEEFKRQQDEIAIKFLAGRATADEYYNSLITKETKTIEEAQIRASVTREIAQLENEVNNEQLLKYERVMAARKQQLVDMRNAAIMSDKQILEGFISSLSSLQSALAMAGEENKKFARAAKILAIGLAIMNTAQGVTRTLAEYPFPFNIAFAAIVAAAGAVQIATIASQKFHSGGMVNGLASDEVPIVAQTGEGILSRRGMSALGGESNLNALNNGNRIGGNVYIDIQIDRPVVSNATDLDKLTEEVSTRLAREMERIR